MMKMIIIHWLVVISQIILVYGTLLNLLYFIQLIIAYVVLYLRRKIPQEEYAWEALKMSAIPVSIIIPAYNEETSIKENVSALLTLKYPKYEVIVINDGSKDKTIDELINSFDLKKDEKEFTQGKIETKPIKAVYFSELYSNLVVVDKENGGKSDALNAGINISKNPLFCVIDADSILDSESLLRAVVPFLEDSRVVAVGGSIRISNGSTIESGRIVSVDLPKNAYARIQILEYLRAFLIAHIAWDTLGILTLISGAFGIFKKDTVQGIGGYDTRTLGEDLELVVRLYRKSYQEKLGYKVKFVPEPVCWTEVPETISVLSRQRSRWQQGALETFFGHMGMLFNPKYGKIGLVSFVYMFLVDVLGPILEVFGYLFIPLCYAYGILSREFFLAYLFLVFVLGCFVSAHALILSELTIRRMKKMSSFLILSFYSIVENFGYRQLNNLFRIYGLWKFLKRDHSWGSMTRKGFFKQ